MNKETHNTLVPALRFPEFQDEEGWEKKTLGDKKIAIFVNEKLSLKDLKLDTYISTENLLADYSGITTSSKLPQSGSFTKFKKDDILISNIRPYLRKIWTATINGAASNDVIVIRANSIVKASFLSFLLKNDTFVNYVMKGAKGVKMPRGDKNLMAEYPILFPTLPEQQKIADCLSSLDELIQTESQVLEALKTHKKGLMQQLFPAEGETVPQLRFPEFMDDEEWEEKSLGEVANIVTGNTPSTNELSYYGEEKLFVSPADISEQRYITQTKTKLTQIGFAQTRKVKANSVLFVCIGSTIGKVAQNKIECATNQQINSLIPKDDYSGDFLYSILEYKASTFASLAGKQAVPIINKTVFSSVELYFPKIEEQQKIADCLSSLDEQIATQSQQIEALKVHKKGLMQQLFPTIDNQAI